jgi:hypothetical protein
VVNFKQPLGATVRADAYVPITIQFPIPVVAVGFYVADLEYPSNFFITVDLNGEPTNSFRIPHTTPNTGATLDDGLMYIGIVDLNGFDFLSFPPFPDATGTDNVYFDNFIAFKLSEVLTV